MGWGGVGSSGGGQRIGERAALFFKIVFEMKMKEHPSIRRYVRMDGCMQLRSRAEVFSAEGALSSCDREGPRPLLAQPQRLLG